MPKKIKQREKTIIKTKNKAKTKTKQKQQKTIQLQNKTKQNKTNYSDFYKRKKRKKF